MKSLALIFFGCGFGGLLRYWVGSGTHLLFGDKFPYGTLLVNVTGSFLMGLLFVLLSQRFTHLNYQLGPLLLVGFLGGYTTFSSFSIETLMLLKSGEILSAFGNIILSVVLCVAAAWLGVLTSKLIL